MDRANGTENTYEPRGAGRCNCDTGWDEPGGVNLSSGVRVPDQTYVWREKLQRNWGPSATSHQWQNKVFTATSQSEPEKAARAPLVRASESQDATPAPRQLNKADLRRCGIASSAANAEPEVGELSGASEHGSLSS